MGSLGTLSIEITAILDTSSFNAIKSAIQNLNKTIASSTAEMAKTVGTSQQAIATAVRSSEKPLKMTEITWVDGVKRITSATNTWEQETKRNVGGIAGSLFNFSKLFEHIANYITFTIGVQMVMGITRMFQSMISTVTDFQKTMTNAVAVSGYVGASFDNMREKLTDLATEMSRESVFSAKDIAKAFYQVASAGYDIAKITKKDFIPILNYAAATQTDLEYATRTVISTMNQFKISTKDTEKVVDLFTYTISKSFAEADKLAESMKYVGAIAGETGQSLEGTNAALAMLYNRGMEGGQAGQRLNMIITKLLEPSKEGQKRLELLGLSMRDLDPYTNSLVDIMYKLRAVNLSAADAVEIFGSRTAGAVMMLISAASEMDNFSQSEAAAVGITKTLAEEQRSTLYGSFKDISNAIDNAYISLTKYAEMLVGVGTVLAWALSPILSILPALALSFIGLYAAIKLTTLAMTQAQKESVAAATGFKTLGVGVKSMFLTILPLTIILGYLGTIFKPLGDNIGLVTAAVVVGTAAWYLYAAGGISAALTAVKSFITAGLATLLVWLKSAYYVIIGWSVGVQAAFAAATMGISILIGLVAANFGTISKAVSDWLNLDRESNAVTEERVRLIRGLKDEIKSLASLELERNSVLRAINEAEKTGNINTEEYNNNIKKAEQLELDIQAARTNSIQTIQEYINSVSSYSDSLDLSLKYYNDEKSSIKKKNDLESEGSRLNIEKTKTQQIYNDVLNDSTSTTQEISDASEDYNEVMGLLIQNEKDLADAEDTRRTAEENVAKSRAALNKYETKQYEVAIQLIDVQYQLNDALSQQAALEKRANILKDADEKLTKNLDASTRDYWEKLLKVLDTQEKLYALEKSRPGILEEIFNALASQGMLTDEIIADYTQLEIAQSELFKSSMEYFKMFSNLSEDQQGALTTAMKFFKQMIDAGVDYGDAWAIAFEQASPEDLGVDLSALGITMPEIDWGTLGTIDMGPVQDYAEDYADLRDVMVEFGDTLGPIMDDLRDMGVISADTYEAWIKWKSLLPETEEALLDNKDAIEGVKQEYLDIVPIISNVWAQLGVLKRNADGVTFALDANGNAIVDVEKSLIAVGSKIPWLTSLMDANKNGVIESNEALNFMRVSLGNATGGWNDFTAQQAVAIISVYASQQAITGLTPPLQNVNGLLYQMPGAPVFDAWTTAAAGTLDPLRGIPVYLEAINTAMGTVSSAVTTLTTKLDGLIEKLVWLAKKPEGMNTLEWFIPGWNIYRAYTTGTEQREWQESEPGRAKGGIVGLQKGITGTKGPISAIIGEAGPEAIVPLSGKNKKYGKDILEKIIPLYFPDLMFMQAGGIAGGTVGTPPPGNIWVVDITPISHMMSLFQQTVSTSVNDFKNTMDGLNTSLLSTSTTFTGDLINSSNTFSQKVMETATSFNSSITSAVSNLVSMVQTSASTAAASYGGGGIGGYGGVGGYGGGGGGRGGGGTTAGPELIESRGGVPADELAKYFPNSDKRKLGFRYKSNKGDVKDLVTTDPNMYKMWKDYSPEIMPGKPWPWQRGGIADKATLGIFGEAGREALIPLTGHNRKFGLEILKQIIPAYYPELLSLAKFQSGGIFGPTGGGGMGSSTTTYDQGVTISGPITVTGVNNVNDFIDQLKYKARAARR